MRLTARKQKLFLAITLAFPLLFLLVVEGALRLFWKGGEAPLFVRAPVRGDYLVANPLVARRWFSFETQLPFPISEPFLRKKPERAFRVFVLGESSTAGFPYPRNVTFSRYLRDVLRDVLPSDSVEVINLGIAATNSFAMADIVADVQSQHPDAIVIYSGHNEWYGALGVGSSESWTLSPSLIRTALRVQHFRIGFALRQLMVAVRRRSGAPVLDSTAVSLMETLARDKDIPLDGAGYRQGLTQFGENLDFVVGRFRKTGIPVFVGSLASNLRDLPPLYSPKNGPADSVYRAARALFATGDTARARDAFVRARDLDVVRFRAPTAFDSVVKSVTQRQGGIYVPVAETFAAAARGGIPGNDLFVEHVHPNAAGYALLGRAFAQAMLASNALPRLDAARLRSWDAYASDRFLTDVDLMVGEHQRRGLLQRWPFVAPDSQKDYRREHVPTTLVDSAAFAFMRGVPWEIVKVQLAEEYEKRRQFDLAAAEYRGLARDAYLFESPERLLGKALMAAGRYDEAEVALRKAMAILPTSTSAHLLAKVLLRKRALPEAIQLLELAQRAEPNNSDILYELAVAKGFNKDVAGARVAALRLAQIAPRHPGLPALLQALGAPTP